MKHFVHKHKDQIIVTIIGVGVVLAVLGGWYAYYVNQVKP